MPFSDGNYERDFDAEELQRYRALHDTLLERYGSHIWHCKIEIDRKLDPECCRQIAKWMSLMPELKTLDLEYYKEANDPFSKRDLKAIEEMRLVQPVMKNLVVLQLFYLPSLVFNKLFGELPQLEKIQIKVVTGEVSLLRNFEFMTYRENLKEAFLTPKEFEDFKYLQSSEPFPALKKLVINLEYVEDDEREHQAYSKWPEWKMIWEILEEKFPSLKHLNMKLLKAFWTRDKKAVIHQSLECRLKLPKLKKLWVVLPNLSCIDFLLPCKTLKELVIVLEHSEWNSERSSDLRRSEVVNLDIDLRNMWESNVWNVFPKLYKLEIRALPENDSVLLDRYTYEKSGGQRKYGEDILSNWVDSLLRMS